MAFSFSPKIVTNGLNLLLDAANVRSYPGSGATWSDLTGNSINGTLGNGAFFSSSNGGTIVFDGVNDFVTGSSNIPLGSQVTIGTWIRHTSLPASINRYLTVGTLVGGSVTETAVIRHDGNSSGNPGAIGQLHFYVRTSGTIKAVRVNNSLVTGSWYYTVGTWDGTTMRLYKNGLQVTSSVPGGTLNATNINYWVSAVTNVEPMSGSIANVQIYTRALTADEVLQNYNANKSRFGLT